MIPQHYFGHILSLLVEQCGWVPLYAARRGPHKSPPYCKSLVSYSYRIYDWETILSLFKQQDDVSVAREKQWQGETVVRNITGVQLNPATARERLEKSFATGQEGYLAAGLNEVSDCYKFEVSEGAGRSTREFEFIWMPNIFLKVKWGKLRIRFYVSKVHL